MNKQAKQISNRPRLGRGLSSLINPAAATPATDQEYQHVTGLPPISVPLAVPAATGNGTKDIPIADISPNPYQPRREFRAEELQELSDSIVQQGVLQPLIVAASVQANAATPYVLIAGERRLRAAKMAGLAAVPCVVRHATGQQMLEWALVENIQRADLNPLERAQAYREYIDRFGLTQVQAAERLGQARATVSNNLRILDLCLEVQVLIGSGRLSFGHAKVLAGILGDTKAQVTLAERVVREDLSVRALEGLAASAAGGAQEPFKPRTSRTKAPYIRDLEEQLTTTVGTRVTIQPGRSRHAGRIVVDYYGLEDFERISGKLGLTIQS